MLSVIHNHQQLPKQKHWYTLRYNPVAISSSLFGPVIIMPFLTLTQKPTYTHLGQARVDLTCSQSDLI